MTEQPNERLYILEMIERGEISAEEGWQRLQDLNSADQDVKEGILEQDEEFLAERFPGAAALPPADMPESGAMQPPPPDFSRWRSLWAIPMWVGIGFTILFAYLMSQAAAAGSVFWMLCVSLPFALGVLLIVIGWGSRTARWLHLPDGRSEIERHWSARRIAHIRQATRRHLPAAKPIGDRVFGEFIRLFSPRRYAQLPSR